MTPVVRSSINAEPRATSAASSASLPSVPMRLPSSSTRAARPNAQAIASTAGAPRRSASVTASRQRNRVCKRGHVDRLDEQVHSAGAGHAERPRILIAERQRNTPRGSAAQSLLR
jgi:hypothetical protein